MMKTGVKSQVLIFSSKPFFRGCVVMYAMFDQTHIHVNFCYIKYLILVVVVSVAAVCRFNLVASSCYQTSLIFYGGIKHKYHDFYSFREIVIQLRINSVSKILHLALI